MKKYLAIPFLLAAIALTGAGCSNNPQAQVSNMKVLTFNVYRVHDDELGVTCWVRMNGGVFCIADKELNQKVKIVE